MPKEFDGFRFKLPVWEGWVVVDRYSSHLGRRAPKIRGVRRWCRSTLGRGGDGKGVRGVAVSGDYEMCFWKTRCVIASSTLGRRSNERRDLQSKLGTLLDQRSRCVRPSVQPGQTVVHSFLFRGTAMTYKQRAAHARVLQSAQTSCCM
ncbi:hypothetical protein IG631_19990 [Alternaria alternata]|nr:hypothetical protein IG631_19990 [Alternaria alternata]